MAQFTVNAQRFDPYKNFKFRVRWDGRYVAGVSKVGMLKRTTEVVKHREGGDPSSSRKSPGRTEYDAITLERGVTHDVDFEQWAGKVWSLGAGRGRVSAVNSLFIGTSNEFGQFESGLTAHWFGTVPAVVLGGVGTLLVTALWSWMFPELRGTGRLTPKLGIAEHEVP